MAIFTLGQITQNRPGARESVTNGPSRSEPTRAIGPIVGEIVVNVQCWCHLLESKCWGKGKTDVAGRYRKLWKQGVQKVLITWRRCIVIVTVGRRGLTCRPWFGSHFTAETLEHNTIYWRVVLDVFTLRFNFWKKKVAPFHFTLYVLSYILYTKAGVQHDGLF